jgi:hypothetical protein
MTVEHGITLFLLGNCITIVFLFIAYYYGSKRNEKEKKPITDIEKYLMRFKIGIK